MSGIYDYLQPQVKVVMVVDQYTKEIIVLRLIYISQSDSFYIRQLNNVIIIKSMVNLPKAHVALAGFSYSV